MTHLHHHDCPQALGVLEGLFAGRLKAAADIGYQKTEHGALVDWDQLINQSWLSTTERAAVLVARGLALAERQGGWPPHLHDRLIDAVRHA